MEKKEPKQFYEGQIRDAVSRAQDAAKSMKCIECSAHGCDDPEEHERLVLELVLVELKLSEKEAIPPQATCSCCGNGSHKCDGDSCTC